MRAWFALVAIAACSSKAEPPAPQADPVKTVPGDAGTRAVRPSQPYEPAPAMHLDDDNGSRPPIMPPTAHAGHPIGVTLRSSPTGARAIVDGSFVGTTPTYWSGDADGHEHEFTFVAPGYALARYRFVPVASGVVHARLEPITDEADAGVPAADLGATAPRPAPPAPIPPPPTVVSPPDAAPAPPPPAPIPPRPTVVSPPEAAPAPADAGISMKPPF